MSRWIVSDNHFNHYNIIVYEGRPFTSTEDMDKFMINKWNGVVNPNDQIFHLGDLSFGNKEYTTDIIHRLNGNISLILGNHDRARSDKWWFDVGVKAVYRYPIIVEKFYILSHEPVYISAGMPYVNFHGHTHGKSLDHLQYINCSVEKNDYTPRDFDLILSSFKSSHEELDER